MTTRIELEQAIIGTILVYNNSFDKICDKLKPEHFTANHVEIFSNMEKLINEGKTASPFTLEGSKEDKQYLIKLSSQAIAPIGLKDYAELLINHWQKEELKVLFETSQKFIDDKTFIEDETKNLLAEEIDRIFFNKDENSISTSDGFELVAKQAEEAYKNNGKIQGISSGIKALDYKLGGFRGDELTVIAGRSAMGKTSFALNLATNAIKQNKSVCFFSLEMSQTQLLNKLVCMKAGIEAEKMRSGKIEEETIVKFMSAKDKIKNEISSKLNIFDRPAQTVAQIKSVSRTMKRKHKCDLIIIDHLNLIGYGNSKDNVTEKLSQITGSLKALTKEMKIPVILLCQLNRAVESQEDKRPSLKDLRGSGSIEQDAEQVIFLYRPEYYLAKMEPENGKYDTKYQEWQDAMQKVKNKCFLIVDKNRNGSTGQVEIYMNVAINEISDIERNIYGGCYD